MSLRVPDVSRGVLVAAGLVLAAGYARDIRPAESRIAAERAAESDASARTGRALVALSDRTRIDALALRIRRDLHGLRMGAGEGSASATFIDDIGLLARRDGLAIAAIRPSASPRPAAAAQGAGESPLRQDDIDVTVRGAFGAAANFLCDLSSSARPTSVGGVDLERASGGGGDAPELQGTLRLHRIWLRERLDAGALDDAVASPATAAPRVRVVRDPFVAGTRQVAAVDETAGTPIAVPVLPPNAGASKSATDEARSAAPAQGHLLALAVGDRRFALLEMDSGTRIVTLGDFVGARRIVRITRRGVAFDDDSSLHLERGI